MKIKFNIGKKLKIAIVLAVLFGVIGFSERQNSDVTVREVVIKIENLHENHFIDEQDIVELMQLDYANLKGANLNRLNLKEIEDRIKADRFIQSAQLYSDVKGNLVVKATLRRPVARIVRPDGPDAYIGEDGTIMPVSEKYTARVVLISGPYVRQFLLVDNIRKHDDGPELMAMLHTIRKDDFWRAQIAQLDIDNKGRIYIMPQVGSQTIEFGKADKLETKLRKLKIFYKDILPQMGWNKYKRVSLEFEGQIVAE
ncbi:MAG: cell division protein FtsQ [Cyclobacteriaceae bacterium]|nr:cell division protein FtsQ [Cyclobacteriaceae bacterium]UYN87818.1 MAG: cell division protein FtsQ [Cyclobacteriaceae bacterium]